MWLLLIVALGLVGAQGSSLEPIASFAQLQGIKSSTFVQNSPRLKPGLAAISELFRHGIPRPSFKSLNHLHVAWTYLVWHDLADAANSQNSSR